MTMETTPSPSEKATSPGPAAGGVPAPPAHEQPVRLPVGRILAGIVAVGAGVVVLGWPVAHFLRPLASDAVWMGGLIGPAAVALGFLGLQPWKARARSRWPMALFGIQGVTVVVVGVAAWVVFSGAKPDPMGFAAALVAGFIGSWVVVAKGLGSVSGGGGASA